MSTRKRALLVGSNYIKTPANRLYGCINDTVNMRNTLMDAFDYDAANIIMLRDDSTNSACQPTRANILGALSYLVSQSANLDEIWFHYSGHGSQIRDTNNDEADKLDEVIVPCDFTTVGFIADDEIFNIIRNVNSKCRMILLFDSCHSASVCDLQWQFNVNTNATVTKSQDTTKAIANPNILCFSGCKDAQTSADAYSNMQVEAVGAFTDSFLTALRQNHMNVDAFRLYRDLCAILKTGGFTQVPAISSSSPTPAFSFLRTSYTGISTLISGGAVLGTPIQVTATSKSMDSVSVPNMTIEPTIHMRRRPTTMRMFM